MLYGAFVVTSWTCYLIRCIIIIIIIIIITCSRVHALAAFFPSCFLWTFSRSLFNFICLYPSVVSD